jgi:mersacidin/lichenicidin family type 2 lantibiotic
LQIASQQTATNYQLNIKETIMSQNEIIRAWKDEEYRNGLNDEQRNHLPENPAGTTELSQEEMESVAGGWTYNCGYPAFTQFCATINACGTFSNVCESFI